MQADKIASELYLNDYFQKVYQMLRKCVCGCKKVYIIRCCKKAYSNWLRSSIKDTCCRKEALHNYPTIKKTKGIFNNQMRSFQPGSTKIVTFKRLLILPGFKGNGEYLIS